MEVSQECCTKIIGFEVGGPAYYAKIARFPTWPGGLSGVTIGIGYDLGQHTVEAFVNDWDDHLSTGTMARLNGVIGLVGPSAGRAVRSLSDISIDYDAAMTVFEEATLPKVVQQTMAAFPNCALLPSDCFGALVDLVYNRGPNVTSPADRRREMRLIRFAMETRSFSSIPTYLRSMKRLWPNVPGLIARREWEALLFERGLVATAVPLPDAVVPRQPIHIEDSSDNFSDELNEQELERVRRINEP